MKGTLLGAEQLERLEALLQEEADGEGVDAGWVASGPPLERVGRDGVLPLSFAQQRLWFLDQLEPGSSAYNIPTPIRLTGPLDVAALERSLNELVRCHEALRTTFATVAEGEPIQVIAPSLTLTLDLVSLDDFPADQREAEAKRLIAEQTRHSFDLAQGPLMLTTLIRLSDEEHVLILNLHHIICDGWSMSILFRELAVLYEAAAGGEESHLPEPSLQYADFAHWQRRWLSGEVLEGQLAYWRERLEGAPAVLELPADRPRPAAQSLVCAVHIAYLPKTLSESLKVISRREGVTLFMTLLAGFQALLARYTSQDDIVVGTPIANRTRSELEGLVGFFVNTLVLRTDTGGDPTFGELLRRVREVTLGAYAHQDVPFEKLVEELRPERDLSHTPLFQVMFALHNTPAQSLRLSGLTLTLLEVETGTAKFDIIFSSIDTEKGLRIRIEYNTDLFDAATIKRLARHFETLLAGAAADPTLRLSELPLLTAEEEEQLLVTWNQTEQPYPSAATLHALFEQQAERTPDAIAVVCADERISYRDLNVRANRVAHYLRGLGVTAESLVGVMMDRSAELVVALLGVLKAGGAYVPLDPGYPQARLAFMAEDAGLRVILTQRELARRVPAGEGMRVVSLDEVGGELVVQRAENPPSVVGAQNLCYVMYTSGSTGVPKGIGVVHRGVARFINGIEHVSVDSSETMLLQSTISFDASTFELWSALLSGARLVVLTEQRPSLEELGEVVRREGVTTLWLTAGLFNQMATAHVEGLRGVRQLLAGGDVLSVGAVRRVMAEVEGCEVTNGYGPTESTTFASCYTVRAPLAEGATSVPIGRPLANTTLYVLDGRMRLVAVGVTGELYIGGDGLARGYIGRPALTAEKFVPNPFSRDGGARLYRTGDLVRYQADSNLEFLGRADGQVKLRGFRIELGEIEAALAGHARVRQAAVLLKGEGDSAQLVAYVVANSGDDGGGAGVVSADEAGRRTSVIGEAELRQYARTLLPDYMVPQRVVMIEELPLTPNGKLDRARLPEPGRADASAGANGHIAPRDAVEEVMAGIWKEVLKVEELGVDENFFDLGGHSLLATRVVSWVRKVFKVEAGLRGLFEEPTVEGFVGAVRREAGEDGWARMQRTAELLLSLTVGEQDEQGVGAKGTGGM